MYREYKPNILLAPYIETYWATDESLSGRQTLRILPDGGINVLFNLAENEVDIIKPFIPYIIGTKTTFSNVVHERAEPDDRCALSSMCHLRLHKSTCI